MPGLSNYMGEPGGWANAPTSDYAPEQLAELRMLAAKEAEAQRLIGGAGLPTANDLFAPMQRQINSQAFNLAGAQAADLASRGLSRSSLQQAGNQDVRRQRASAMADASMQAAQQAKGMRDDARERGEAMRRDAWDRRQALEAARSAQRQQDAEAADQEKALNKNLLVESNPIWNAVDDAAGGAISGGLNSAWNWLTNW